MFRFNLRIAAGVVALGVLPITTRVLQAPAARGALVRSEASTKAPQWNGQVLRGHSAGENQKTKSETPRESEERNRRIASDEMQRQIQLFLNEFASQGAQLQPRSNRRNTPSAKATNSYHMAIAIVPDPVHTHLALRFDRIIDDLQFAMQDIPCKPGRNEFARLSKLSGIT